MGIEQDRERAATSNNRSGQRSTRATMARRVWTAVGGLTATLAATAFWGVTDPGSAHAAAGAPWQVLVYAVNDAGHDLPLGEDLDEMVAASRSGVNFTVYVDNSDATEYDSNFVATTSEAMIVEIADGTATVTDTLGELDSGSPDTLGWFVATGLQRHPAARTALVVWGHGNGWQGIAYDGDKTTTGEPRDRSSIDAEELGRALDTGLAAAGQDDLDLVMLDACLMANLEVAAETATAARYLIASEESVSGVGLDYDAFSIFATEPKADALRIFDVLAAGFRADVERLSPPDADMITLSLTDLSKVPALEQAASAFSQAAAVDVANAPATYRAAGDTAFQYGVEGEDWAGYLDLGDYLRRLNTPSPTVAPARDALLAALDAAVLAHIGSPSYTDASGLTVYLPPTPDPDYHAQPTAHMWSPFLTAIHQTPTKS